jgi:hypothetical protein
MRLELPAAAMVVPIALVAAGAWITARTNLWIHGSSPVPAAALGAIAVTYVGIILWVMPALEQHKVVPELARWTSAHASPGARLASYRMNRWNTAFRFYLDRHTTILESPEEAREFFAQPGPFYCVMLARAYEEFAAQGVPLQVVYTREGMTATSGRVLWRQRVPFTEFVIVTLRQAQGRPSP